MPDHLKPLLVGNLIYVTMTALDAVLRALLHGGGPR